MKVDAAYLEVTNRCNLNCATCYNRSGINRETRELKFDDLLACIRRLQSFGCRAFTFSGGEPMLYRELDALLTYMEDNPQLDFSLVTNGTRVTEPILERLKKLHNLKVQVSLDGSCEEENAKTRGEGNFEKAITTLRALQDAGIPCFAAYVISRRNLSDVQLFFERMVEESITPSFSFIMRQGNGSDDWEEKGLTSVEKIKIMGLLHSLTRDGEMPIAIPGCSYACPLAEEGTGLNVLVKNDGSLYPCQSLYDPAYCMGNLLSDSDETLGNGVRYIQELAQKRREADFGCTTCMIRNQCGKGCIAIADSVGGNALADDGECTLRKAFFLRNALGWK
ncbi:MAG: radical SAM protein [Clostridia bacterium]|nr:radical SAM protein [Clostridia bacterium]